jgi:nitrogen regulatory protein PII
MAKMPSSSENDDRKKALESIEEAARTGKIGDGKIFVSSIEHLLRIRTGERDGEAL